MSKNGTDDKRTEKYFFMWVSELFEYKNLTIWIMILDVIIHSFMEALKRFEL
jgi:hypothetical protein